VGTDIGKLELWSIETSELKKEIDAHAGSAYGITAIVPLLEPSELITNERPNAITNESGKESTYFVTAAGDKPSFKIWKILKNASEIDITMHIKIDTTLTSGIHFLLQTSSTQIVCCDNT
jgi:hypothetical protein